MLRQVEKIENKKMMQKMISRDFVGGGSQAKTACSAL